jgi:hypothetical protein
MLEAWSDDGFESSEPGDPAAVGSITVPRNTKALLNGPNDHGALVRGWGRAMLALPGAVGTVVSGVSPVRRPLPPAAHRLAAALLAAPGLTTGSRRRLGGSSVLGATPQQRLRASCPPPQKNKPQPRPPQFQFNFGSLAASNSVTFNTF